MDKCAQRTWVPGNSEPHSSAASLAPLTFLFGSSGWKLLPSPLPSLTCFWQPSHRKIRTVSSFIIYLFIYFAWRVRKVAGVAPTHKYLLRLLPAPRRRRARSADHPRPSRPRPAAFHPNDTIPHDTRRCREQA